MKLKKNITQLLDVVNRYTKRLDAMWWVWCSSMCKSGIARYSEAELTEEIVEIAEKNVKRLRTKLNALTYRKEHYPDSKY